MDDKCNARMPVGSLEYQYFRDDATSTIHSTLLPGSIGVACGVVRWSESFSSLVAPCRVPRNGVMEASATATRDNKPEMAPSNRPRGENGLVNDIGHEALL